MRLLSSIVVVLAGCTESGSKMTIHVQFGESPPVVAAQDGDGPWQQLLPGADGRAQFTVTTGRYGFVTMCDVLSPHARVELSTKLTDRTVDCAVSRSGSLTGATAPGAEVSAGNFTVTADLNGAYSLGATIGTHDVFAVVPGSPAKIVARRNFAVAGDMALDLPVAEAQDMVAITPTVTGARGPVTVYADLTTAHDDYVYFGDNATTVQTLPPTLRTVDDRPSIGAAAGGCTAQKPATGTPTLAIAGAIGAQLTPARATWTADPAIAWEFVAVSLRRDFTAPPPRSSVEYFADIGWLAGATELDLVDVTTLPGWRAGLPKFDPGQSLRWNVRIERGDRAADMDSCSVEGTAAF